MTAYAVIGGDDGYGGCVVTFQVSMRPFDITQTSFSFALTYRRICLLFGLIKLN